MFNRDSVKRLDEADPARIGMWGHSMGGFITLRSMVISDEIKAGVIWGGVVVSFPDLFTRWRRGDPNEPTPTPDPTREARRRRGWPERFSGPALHQRPGGRYQLGWLDGCRASGSDARPAGHPVRRQFTGWHHQAGLEQAAIQRVGGQRWRQCLVDRRGR